MAYFEDLSIYSYHGSHCYRTITKNIGWLAADHSFEKREPTERILDLIWNYCTVSVARMRGIHKCEFCPPGDWHNAERHGKRLLLGTSEIRVFGKDEIIYAAPTLIYHYVWQHHYKPPDEFIQALTHSSKPPDQEFFKRLETLKLEWAPKQNEHIH